MKKQFRMILLVLVGLGFSFSGLAQSFLTNGLVAYYPFNGNANDASGNGHNGTNHNAVLTTNRFGNANQAYRFSGPTEYITVPLDADVFRNDFTVSVWYNAFDYHGAWPDILHEQNDSFTMGIIGETSNTPRPDLIGHIATGQNAPQGSWGWIVYSQQLTLVNRFCQVTVRRAGTNATVYWNGEIAGTAVMINTNTPAGGYLTIGRADPAVYPDYTTFHGAIDDIRIYNRALSDSEVAQLYAIESGPRVDLIKAVKPLFSHLTVGTNYQMQLSTDMNNWTNYGAPFTATNTSMVYPQYFDVEDWGSLYFRLH